MKLARFKEILEAYGADPARWPDGERERAEMLLAQSSEAQACLQDAAELDSLLARHPISASPRLDPAALAQSVTRTPQARSNVVRVPPSGRWQPINWPGVAGLAAAAFAGFLIGWSGLDSQLIGAQPVPADPFESITVVEQATW